MRQVTDHRLDNPALTSLTGPHARFAECRGRVLRYPREVSQFVALPDAPVPADWEDLATLAGPGNRALLPASAAVPPAGWDVEWRLEGLQMVLEDHDDASFPYQEVLRLGSADVPEMLALAERTRPGPFHARTIELGAYYGIRRGGELVAMAGERLRPPGWAETSAVCTTAAHRGQGLAARLVLAVAADARSRGDRSFLHVTADNTRAVRLYESLGFRVRCRTAFTMVRVPAPARRG
ncbi:GNAT family N-acetyltransferase [Streptomyces sp. AC555_RSS877]|uniref:GNAT family N-acetyltransferase n=1 Tax=Streptomyces sp. AC555_RSS877 TaxID=2823688 RepID=UPI001C276C25|nr:GNAT family N-acetyltransferase [Streptomyces sp. AC555_RSS877]